MAMFYKSSQRSTVLDLPQRPRRNDHDNQVEELGQSLVYDDDRDYVLDTIARAARAEADSATATLTGPSTTSKERLSAFENELLWAWSEK